MSGTSIPFRPWIAVSIVAWAGLGAPGSALAQTSGHDALPPVQIRPAQIRGQLEDIAPPGQPAVDDRLRPLAEVTLMESRRRQLRPQDFAAERFAPESTLQLPGACRLWADSLFAWEAPALCHRPLYFENENLERHGRSHGLAQPAVSAAHFGGRVLAWPYLAGATSPHECIYTLGRDLPGSCAPYRHYRPPVSAKGALYQAGAVAGVAAFVP